MNVAFEGEELYDMEKYAYEKYAHFENLSVLSQIGVTLLDTSGNLPFKSSVYEKVSGFVDMLQNKLDCAENCRMAFLYGCYQSRRFGGRYNFIAPSGLSYCAAPLLEMKSETKIETKSGTKIETKGEMVPGVLIGPFLLMNYDDFMEYEILKRNQLTDDEVRALWDGLQSVPHITSEHANAASEQLRYIALTYSTHMKLTESVPKQPDLSSQAYPTPKGSNIITKAVDYIKRNYSTKLSLQEIADHLFVSRQYFCRIFKESTGQTPGNYITFVRIEESKKLLRNPNIKIIDIPGLVGFENQSYFTKIFKKESGQTPGRYRRENVDYITKKRTIT